MGGRAAVVTLRLLATAPVTRPLALALVLVAVPASGQPASTDSVAVLPPFRVPITEDFAPPHTSAARAYLYSALATGGAVAVGLALEAALGDSPPESDGSLRDGAGPGLVLIGVMLGPSVGNLSLGAAGDARRAFVPKTIGLMAGGALVLMGLGSEFLCVADQLATGEGCRGNYTVFLTVAGVVTAGGIVVGTVIDLTTIPANAARAQRYRRAHPRVSVAPGWRAGAPALGVRVGL